MFILTSNDGKADLMRHKGNRTESEMMLNCFPIPYETCEFMRGKLNQCHSSVRMAWPPDALTRLLMEADGVTESTLDSLLRRVARKREV